MLSNIMRKKAKSTYFLYGPVLSVIILSRRVRYYAFLKFRTLDIMNRLHAYLDARSFSKCLSTRN